MTEKTFKLKIVGHVPEPKPDKDGFLPIPFFAKKKGTYRIDINEDNKPCLLKIFKNPYRISCFPFIILKGKKGEPVEVMPYLQKGGTIVVDTDVLALE